MDYKNIISIKESSLFENIKSSTIDCSNIGNVSDLFGSTPVAVSKIENSWANIYGAFVNGSIVFESCLLSQYTSSFKNDIGKNYLNTIVVPSAIIQNENFIENAFYCLNYWDSNYQHFILETLPKIYVAVNTYEYPIFVFDAPHVRDILKCMFPSSDFIYIAESESYFCSSIYLVSQINENFFPLIDLQIAVLSKLRESVIKHPPSTKNDIYYLGRLNTSGIAGFHRRITNQSDFERTLIKHNVYTDDFNGKSLVEKSALASKSLVQITPIGANLMNYLFAYDSLELYVIDHPYFDSHEFFKRMFKLVGLKINYNILKISEVDQTGNDWKGLHNSPYSINIEKFDNFLACLKFGS